MSTLRISPASAGSHQLETSVPHNLTTACHSVVASQTVEVILVSGCTRDVVELRNCLRGSAWTIKTAFDLNSALELLSNLVTPIIICSDDIQGGSWQEVLAVVRTLPGHPKFIFATDTIDSGLWAEALHLGAHDVIAKPFNNEEVLHVVRTAWLSLRHTAQVARAAC